VQEAADAMLEYLEPERTWRGAGDGPGVAERRYAVSGRALERGRERVVDGRDKSGPRRDRGQRPGLDLGYGLG
ncbi:MAG: hypothetical protein ACRDY1_04265, partial [Acidimicrobiales bacterium]